MSLKEIRLAHEMSQQKLAEKVQVSISTIARIEKENSCNVNLAKKISELFGKTIEEIFYT